jgi:hypothetical protein
MWVLPTTCRARPYCDRRNAASVAAVFRQFEVNALTVLSFPPGHKVAAVTAEDRAAAFGAIESGVTVMVDILPKRRGGDPAPHSDAGAEAERIERSVQEFPRRDAVYRGRPAEPAGENIAGHANSIMQRVAVTSVTEIENLIGELERLRDFVRQEGIRLQREIEGYARLSEEATKSTKIIAESVAQWKSALEHMSGRRG